jgi:hypothetical protein
MHDGSFLEVVTCCHDHMIGTRDPVVKRPLSNGDENSFGICKVIASKFMLSGRHNELSPAAQPTLMFFAQVQDLLLFGDLTILSPNDCSQAVAPKHFFPSEKLLRTIENSSILYRLSETLFLH